MVRRIPSIAVVFSSRWVVCALLFLATTINYMDRQILGILAPTLQREIGWSEMEYGGIVTSFQGAYAFGLFVFGYIIDRFGSRRGLILAVFAWSVAACLHGWVRSVVGFAIARFALGIAEAGNFPASIKTVAEVFPKRERALAIGIFNGGANIGAVLTPLIVPYVALTWGWRSAFFIIGSLGFFWVLLALKLLRPSPSGGLREVRHGEDTRRGGVNNRALSLHGVLRHRATWGFAVAKFLTDPIWWFYLYWTPKYLNGQFRVDLAGLAAPLIIIYLMADVGSICGGWASSRMIAKDIHAPLARRRVMLWCSLGALSVVSVPAAPSVWFAVLLLGLATAAHQAWSANLFSLVSDIFPAEVVGSVVGVGGMAGAVGGMLIATVAGIVLDLTGSYLFLFLICGFSYLIAWFCLGAFMRKANLQFGTKEMEV